MADLIDLDLSDPGAWDVINVVTDAARKPVVMKRLCDKFCKTTPAEILEYAATFGHVWNWVQQTQCPHDWPPQESDLKKDPMAALVKFCATGIASASLCLDDYSFVKALCDECDSRELFLAEADDCKAWLTDKESEWNNQQVVTDSGEVHVAGELDDLLGDQGEPRSFFPPLDKELLTWDKEAQRILKITAQVMKGPLTKLDTWRRVQHRSAMHDVYEPLREGIKQITDPTYKNDEKWILKHHRKVYFTKITNYTPQDGTSYMFDSHVSVNLKTSKWLQYGNLCVFSSKRFKPDSLLFGTVVNGDDSGKGKGKGKGQGKGYPGGGTKGATGAKGGMKVVRFSVALDPRSLAAFLIGSDPTGVEYEMVESKADYRMARMVLDILDQPFALQHAMASAILTGRTVMPPYLKRQHTEFKLDIRAVLSDGGHSRSMRLVPNPNGPADLVFAKDIDFFSYVPCTLGKYEHKLDDTQESALKLALTQNVAIIQGPPGTGKTFLGAKIVQLLHTNREALGLANSMIYVVCLTNHALDSFLEDILHFVPKNLVLRLGNNSKSEAMEQLTLRKKMWRQTGAKKAKCLQAQEELVKLYKEPNPLGKNVHIELKQLRKDNPLCRFVQQVEKHHDEQTRQRQSDYNAMKKERDREVAMYKKAYEQEKKLAMRKENIIDDLPKERERLQKVWHAWIAKLDAVTSAMDDVTVYASMKQDMLHKAFPRVHSSHLRVTFSDMNMAILDNARDNAKLWTTPEMFRECKKVKAQLKRDSEAYRADVKEMEATAAAMLEEYEEPIKQLYDEWKKYDNSNALWYWAFGTNPSGSDDEYSSEELAGHYEAEVAAMQRDQCDEGSHQVIFLTQTQEEVYADLKQYRDRNPHEVSDDERRDIYYCLKLSLAVLHKERIERKIKEVVAFEAEFKDEKAREELRVIRSHFIVGATTAGAAMHLKTMQQARPTVVIVEEAAEVPESHVLTTLTESVDQLILIGDHKQLQPKTSSYSKDVEKVMGVSMMERLAGLELQYGTLGTQRRMHPDISAYTKGHYPEVSIIDHETTVDKQQRPVPYGVLDHKRVLFVHHDVNRGQGETLGDSPFSKHEAMFSVTIAKYLLTQPKCAPVGITLLAPYTGQVVKLMEQAKDLGIRYATKQGQDGVRIASIDDYQGEENDFIVLCLVRHDTITGFMKYNNRVCVALSRAKRGMYILAHSDWKRLFKEANDSLLIKQAYIRAVTAQCVVDGFPAVCETHQNKLTFSNHTTYQQKVKKEGGCGKTCLVPLPCGHSCPSHCHPHVPGDHEFKGKCMEPCTKGFDDCDHLCKQRCHEKCVCKTRVTGNGPCGHPFTRECWEWKENVALPPCKKPCTRMFADCKHSCKKKCCETCRCDQLVTEKRRCGHAYERECWKWKTNAVLPDCQDLCGRGFLDCPHTCKRKCYKDCLCETEVAKPRECTHVWTQECWKWKTHAALPRCKEPCVRGFTDCTHKCKKLCCELCQCEEPVCKKRSCGHPFTQACWRWKEKVKRPPCEDPCSRGFDDCEHKCKKKCHETCICEERVKKELPCGHTYTQECWKWKKGIAPPPCKERCSREIKDCGHQCRKKCFETCRCTTMVTKTLECGHDLTRECYKWKEKEPVPDCTKKCTKTLECGHACENKCFEACKCELFVERATPCGHKNKQPCWMWTEGMLPVCGKKCGKKCGGCQTECTKKCFEVCKCEVKVTNKTPCGHDNEQPCWMWTEGRLPVCEKKCGKSCGDCGTECAKKCCEACQCVGVVTKPLLCGHPVPRKCWEWTEGVKPPNCTAECGKELSCGHRCKQACGRTCTCYEKVEGKREGCGHVLTQDCWRWTAKNMAVCSERVTITLPCGHEKNSTCGGSRTCDVRIQRECGHDMTCGDTRPCQVDVDARCPKGHEVREICCERLQCKKCDSFVLDIGDFEGKPTLVALREGSDEYAMVERRFKATSPQLYVTKIEAVYHKAQWALYQHNVDQCRERWGEEPLVKLCFHGTSDPSKIYTKEEGFDPTYSRDGMWGTAAYFAENSSYSVAYAGGTQQLFLAEVLVGKTITTGPTRHRQPPQFDKSRLYDSVTGSTGGSTVHMVYYTGRAYPKYLITFSSAPPVRSGGILGTMRGFFGP